jgi:hypothetical protein
MAYIYKVCIMVTISSLILGAGTVREDKHASGKQTVIDAIEKVRTGATPADQYYAAQDLAALIHKADRKNVEEKMATGMIPLLEIPGARIWIIESLGFMGSNAKIAVPRLTQLLAEEDCRNVGMSIAPGIRLALKRIGVKPPIPKYREE